MASARRLLALRGDLDALVTDGAPRQLLAEDPVGIVRAYRRSDDRELVGLLAGLLAYGRVASIRRSLRILFDGWGMHPSDALREGRHFHPTWAPGFQHRWTRRADVMGLFEAVRQVWAEEGSLGAALADRARSVGTFEGGLVLWVSELRARAAAVGPIDRVGTRRGRANRGLANGGVSTRRSRAREHPVPTRGLRFLLADPAGSSACKRLRLFLRWMVRPDDGIDLGVWHGRLKPNELILPLDVHWARMGPRLGLSRRRIPDGRMAREITENLCGIRPEDPLIYDFPVCHLGISGGCPGSLTTGHCLSCPLRSSCPTGRRRIASKGTSTRMQDPSP